MNPLDRGLLLMGRAILARILGVAVFVKLPMLASELPAPIPGARGFPTAGGAAGWLVLVAEAIVAVGLLRSTWRVAAFAVSLMAAAFTIFVAWVHAHGLDVTRCGCLGRIEVAFHDHLWLLAAMNLLAIGCLFASGRDSDAPVVRRKLHET